MVHGRPVFVGDREQAARAREVGVAHGALAEHPRHQPRVQGGAVGDPAEVWEREGVPLELEVPDGEQTDYRKAVKALPGEKIVFSWVVWPDRKAGALAHNGMWEDPRWQDIEASPVDAKRMIMGGFEPILAYRKD